MAGATSSLLPQLSRLTPPGLTIASLRNMTAGVSADTPLLVPRADGEGYEPLVMASAANVGAHLTAASPTAGAAG